MKSETVTASSASCGTATSARRSAHTATWTWRTCARRWPRCADVGACAPAMPSEEPSRTLAAFGFVNGLLPGVTESGKTKGRRSGFPLRRPALQMEREMGFERLRRWVNSSRRDAPLPFIAARPFEFPVRSRSTWSRPVPALGAWAGHMWGTWAAFLARVAGVPRLSGSHPTRCRRVPWPLGD
jgi:hypothetical protein